MHSLSFRILHNIVGILFYGILYTSFTQAQQVYVTLGTADTAKIGLLNTESCDFEIIYTNPTTASWNDLAFCPNGKLYGCVFGIDEIDLVNQDYTRLYPLPLSYDQNGLVCSCDTIIYGAGARRDVFSYNVNTGEFKDHGKLPIDMYIQGDLFFYEGNLYGTGGANPGERRIIRIDLESPANSEIVFQPTEKFLKGFYLVDEPCEDPYFYTEWNFDLSEGDPENARFVGFMDPVTFELTEQCFYFSENGTYGWAYGGEGNCQEPPPCAILIDLDGDDSAGLTPIDYTDTLYCGIGLIPTADADVFVDTGKPWDSIRIAIVFPPGSAAMLEGVAVPGITFSWLGADELVLVNSGDATDTELATQLSLLTLTPDPAFLNTTYIIAVVGYAEDLVSDTAFAYLYVGGRSTSAGDDVNLVFCSPQTGLYDLSQDLPPDATTGGTWSDPAPQSGMIDLVNFDNSSFYYIVEDPQCPADSALWQINLDERPIFDLGNDTVLCTGHALTLDAPSGMEFMWQDGSQSIQQTVTQNGLYWLEVTTDLNCQYRDSIFVEIWDEILRDTTLYLCQADSVAYLGDVYTTPGIFDNLVVHPDDCDTLWMVEVIREVDEFQIVTQGTLCDQGEVGLIAPSIAGASYQWSTGSALPFIEVSEADTYAVSVMYGNNCVISDTIIVPACEKPQFYIPNIFSPNGDGVNESFQVYAKDVTEVELQIFDRWGDVLFYTHSPLPAWNGRSHGKIVPPGVYVYTAKITFNNGTVVNTSGSVTLVR